MNPITLPLGRVSHFCVLSCMLIAAMIAGCTTIYLPPIPYIPKKPDWYKEYKKNRVYISGYLKERAKTDNTRHEASKYAMLVNSDTTLKHRENMQMAYETLIRSGFPAGNIFVLRCTPYHHYRDSYAYHVTAGALKDNFGAIMNYFEKHLREDDLLLVYITGHGYRKKYLSWFILEDDDVSSEEYVKAMDHIRCKTIVSVLDPCHSGGFATAMRANKRAITITDTDAGNQTNCRYFAHAFWGSFADSSCDLNGDGKVSVKEAYDIAIAEHKKYNQASKTKGSYCAPKGRGEVFLH